MPAILVETAFITNKTEEKLLNSAAFRQKVAEAITAAAARYKRHYDKKMAQSN
jgi:N-acetylmuramoyl-L-alanine amidase